MVLIVFQNDLATLPLLRDCIQKKVISKSSFSKAS